MKRERLFEGLPQVGGHPAIDLMNTVEYRERSDRGDRIASFDRLLGWCELAGLIDRSESRCLDQVARDRPEVGERIVRDVARLREGARKALGARLNGTVDADAMELLRGRIEQAARRVRVTVDADGTRFSRRHQINDPGELVDRIALSIEDAFMMAGREPLRECEGGNCDWLFFDRSRSGRRRWCHPGQCGNAERVRNFRTRRAAKPAGSK